MRDIMLILHFLGLTMGLGTGFAHAFLGAASARLSPEEGTKFRLGTLSLGLMGHIGIALLVISGLYLITPYWKVLSSMPLLMLKLGLVLTLIILITLIGNEGKKAKQGNADLHFNRMKQMGKLTLLIGVAIVVVAVKVFH